jgi:hypothetical protein
MNGFYFNLLIGQDLQDYLDFFGFPVSSRNREKILFILLILSNKKN